MLHVVEPGTAQAYPIPWRVDRAGGPHPRVTNGGLEAVEHVRVFRSDGATERWGRLLPDEAADVCLCGADLDEVIVTLCWFRPSTGVEYAWRFVM